MERSVLRDLLYPGVMACAYRTGAQDEFIKFRVNQDGAFVDMKDGSTEQVLTNDDIDDGSFATQKFNDNAMKAFAKWGNALTGPG